MQAEWLDQQVTCFELLEGQRTSTAVAAVMQVQPRNRVYRLRTATGFEIIATSEHPFWTPDGMKPLKHLKIGEPVALYPFEGVPYADPPDEILLDTEQVRDHLLKQGKSENAIRQIITQLQQHELLPLHANSPQLPYLVKIMAT
jgi:tRNA-splicing ligase RtcB (3'-phosphate/5'-hydroxy nucleic acid ligase)